MAYIGKQPVVGNFQKCDAITVVNGQAAYTLNVGGSAVSPENANHMLVSLNGVLQAPGDSFTVSGSTLTFASNLATGDVIDFVIILGDVLDLGTPSDNSISTAKLVANSVTAAKFNADVISGQTALAEAPADTDEFLVSDGGVIKRIDYSLIKGGGMYELISTTTLSSTTNVDFTSLSTDFQDFKIIGSGIVNSANTQSLACRFFDTNGLLLADTTSAGVSSNSPHYDFTQFGHDDDSFTQDSQNQTRIDLGQNLGNDAGAYEVYSFEVDLLNPHLTDRRTIVHSKVVYVPGDSYAAAVQFSQGFNTSSEGGDHSRSGIRLFVTSGNFASGKISFYGRKA